MRRAPHVLPPSCMVRRAAHCRLRSWVDQSKTRCLLFSLTPALPPTTTREKDDFSWRSPRRRPALIPRHTADCSNFLRPGLFFILSQLWSRRWICFNSTSRTRRPAHLAFWDDSICNCLESDYKLQENCGEICFQLISIEQEQKSAANALKFIDTNADNKW